MVGVKMPPMLRSALLKSLLVLALLFAQQGAVTHSISHVLAEQSQDQSLPHHQHCDLCAVYAQIGGAIGSSHISFDFSSSFEETLTAYSVSFRSIAFTAFAARAPPRSA
jgi:uncharacterized protein (DUF2126 family)